MMKHFFENISADSLTGMIFAAEGIANAVVLLNGPMGCKFYHSTTSQFLEIRPLMYLPSKDGKKVPVDYNYLNSWFFRQPRVPCTYLDSYDYVYGTAEKVREGLEYLRDALDFDSMLIVNSPGASLIGDNLKELADQVLPEKACVMLESPGYSRDFDSGYAEAALEILKQTQLAPPSKKQTSLAQPSKKQTTSVNVIGLSIWNRYYEGDKEEIRRMLELCGIQVNCFLCAGCSVEEIRHFRNADLNLVIDPSRGSFSAKYLKERYDMDYYLCEDLPIGFDETEKICTELCRRLGTDPQALLEDSEKARARCWYHLNNIYQMCGLPKGVIFSVDGSESQKKAYSRFLTEYLGMVPEPFSLEKAENSAAELVFGDANAIAAMKLTGRVFCGIEISFPGMGYTDIVPKTHLGVQGALFLTEQVINGLMSKL